MTESFKYVHKEVELELKPGDLVVSVAPAFMRNRDTTIRLVEDLDRRGDIPLRKPTMIVCDFPDNTAHIQTTRHLVIHDYYPDSDMYPGDLVNSIKAKQQESGNDLNVEVVVFHDLNILGKIPENDYIEEMIDFKRAAVELGVVVVVSHSINYSAAIESDMDGAEFHTAVIRDSIAPTLPKGTHIMVSALYEFLGVHQIKCLFNNQYYTRQLVEPLPGAKA